MNTTTALIRSISHAHLEVLEEACKGRHPTTVRQFRRDICRFVNWSTTENIDPLRPSRVDLDRYRATLDPKPVEDARWKLDYALRAFVNAGGAMTDEHGLGAGSAPKEGVLSDDPGLAYIVQALLDSRQSARDRWVYRSGMNKLARWAREFDVDLMAIDAADLEDFRAWVQAVGGSAGEILVIARRFVRLMNDEDMRRAVIRARSSRSSRLVSTAPKTDVREVA